MSLLTAVEEAIKSLKAEQARINENTLRYKEILQSIAPPPEKDTEVLECPEDAAADLSLGEKEEIDLLERALEKALRIRSATETSQRKPKQPGPLKGPAADVKPRNVPQASEVCKGRPNSQSSNLRTSTSSKLGSRAATKHRDKINPTKSHSASSAETMAVSTCGPHAGSQVYISASEYKAVRSLLRDEDADKPAATSRSDQTGKQNRRPSEQAGTWKSVIIKQNRLWEKVMAAQRKPVPGRSRFMERMRATFPKDQAYGAPDQNRVLVNQLSHQQLDPIQSFQSRELLAQRAADGGTKPEGQAWDGRWAEGAGLCPTRPEGDGMLSALPLTVTYTTEAELRQLERLRMKVELLQQEVDLEQALWDALSPLLSAVICGPVCPNPSVLRDIYSLLAEGGHTFPAIVLDSEPD
ncbi:uncharacterized protein tedc2 [Genypterus blacodes]|uniref:uncharacterized protein tedc2 n=1 Tax=Genypterus blacodes TaxID=154954 RepID=UPI003F772184